MCTVCLVTFLVCQEPYYDPRSGQGYLAYRLKTVQRTTSSDFKKRSKPGQQGGPKSLRETSSSEQLLGEECNEAMSMMKHTTDQATVKGKMKATFKHRQELLHDPAQSSLILDHFSRFLDTPGLVSIWGKPELLCTSSVVIYKSILFLIRYSLCF